MIGGVTRRGLPHLPGVPDLHVNKPLNSKFNSKFISNDFRDIDEWMEIHGLFQFFLINIRYQNWPFL